MCTFHLLLYIIIIHDTHPPLSAKFPIMTMWGLTQYPILCQSQLFLARNSSYVCTLMCLIKGSTRLGLQRVFSTKNLLIRHQPIYFKRKFHPRQDVYYILFAILFSNISKTYKSKTLIVNHFCPGRLYFFKNPSESHLLWTRLLLGTWE